LVGTNLLSLPHFPAKRTNGKELLVDDSQSHVVTLEEHLTIVHQKAMDKEVAKHIIKTRKKEKQNK
jgi:hypothetical protein